MIRKNIWRTDIILRHDTLAPVCPSRIVKLTSACFGRVLLAENMPQKPLVLEMIQDFLDQFDLVLLPCYPLSLESTLHLHRLGEHHTMRRLDSCIVDCRLQAVNIPLDAGNWLQLRVTGEVTSAGILSYLGNCLGVSGQVFQTEKTNESVPISYWKWVSFDL